MIIFSLDLKNAARGWDVSSSSFITDQVKVEFSYPSRMTGEMIIQSIASTLKAHDDCKWLSLEEGRMTLDCSGFKKWLLTSYFSNCSNHLRWLPDEPISDDLTFLYNPPLDPSLTSVSVTFSKFRLPKPIGTEQVSMPKTPVEIQESLKKFKADHPDDWTLAKKTVPGGYI